MVRQLCCSLLAWSKEVRTSARRDTKRWPGWASWLWLSPKQRKQWQHGSAHQNLFFFLKVWAIQMWWSLFSVGTECHEWKPVRLSFMISWKTAGKTKQRKGQHLITYRVYLMISTQQQKGNINSSHRKKRPLFSYWHGSLAQTITWRDCCNQLLWVWTS